jgi:glutamine synthetase
MNSTSFIERHGLRGDDERRQADELRRRVQADDARLIRLTWSDPHGHSRAKMLTVPAFFSALDAGYNINVATSTLDLAGSRIFASFTRGGGMGLDEMTGSPNLTVVPDPTTFRMLPWAPGVGWILCDEYFTSGVPFHFSSRQLLRKQLRRPDEAGYRCMVGLEVEWYLLRVADEPLGAENVGAPGVRGRPLKTYPAEPGYSYHSESNMDLMQPVLSALGDAYDKLGLPLRSIENEWGPGQVECTFAPCDALQAADNMLLFRSATRQICRRMGYFATFMARPAIKGYYASGWHLHQSLVAIDGGRNLFMPETADERLSALGRAFLGGLLHHAVPSTPFATPTVNGYRRFRANSLAPDRVTWAFDNRGAMFRVLGGPNDPATRIENRVGEPAANPYLFIASQIVAGLAGVAQKLEPGTSDDEPYAAKRAMLPKRLAEALDALDKEPLYRRELGDIYVDYFVKLKRNELGRFEQFLKQAKLSADGDEPTEWEQNEYFDFF